MSDIVAQLEVLAQESGCLIDISAIIDTSICSKIDVKTHKPHKVEEKDDYICVIPTEEEHVTKKRCDKKTCYEVHEEVCRKNTVALDNQLLILLGLLTKEELEKYLRTTGAITDDEALDLIDGEWAKNVKLDPLLSVTVGDEEDNILDLAVDDEDGLVTLDLLGQENVLIIGDKKGNGILGGLLNLDGLVGPDGLLGGGGGGLVGRSAHYPHYPHYPNHNGRKKLLDVDVGGQKDPAGEEATIDVDAFTHPRMFRRQGRLLDLDVGGERDEDQADIDVDLFTHGPDKNHGGIIPGGIIPGGNNGGIVPGGIIPGGIIPGGNNGNNGNCNNNGHCKPTTRPHYPSLITHYQPICSKGFRKTHRDGAEKCHAEDVNHCLAICHSKSALVTIDADVQVGDVANIQLCAAIVFDKSADGDNCHYFVAPETEPCHEEELEEDENCVAFIRN